MIKYYEIWVYHFAIARLHPSDFSLRLCDIWATSSYWGVPNRLQPFKQRSE